MGDLKTSRYIGCFFLNETRNGLRQAAAKKKRQPRPLAVIRNRRLKNSVALLDPLRSSVQFNPRVRTCNGGSSHAAWGWRCAVTASCSFPVVGCWRATTAMSELNTFATLVAFTLTGFFLGYRHHDPTQDVMLALRRQQQQYDKATVAANRAQQNVDELRNQVYTLQTQALEFYHAPQHPDMPALTAATKRPTVRCSPQTPDPVCRLTVQCVASSECAIPLHPRLSSFSCSVLCGHNRSRSTFMLMFATP